MDARRKNLECLTQLIDLEHPYLRSTTTSLTVFTEPGLRWLLFHDMKYSLARAFLYPGNF